MALRQPRILQYGVNGPGLVIYPIQNTNKNSHIPTLSLRRQNAHCYSSHVPSRQHNLSSLTLLTSLITHIVLLIVRISLQANIHQITWSCPSLRVSHYVNSKIHRPQSHASFWLAPLKKRQLNVTISRRATKRQVVIQSRS